MAILKLLCALVGAAVVLMFFLEPASHGPMAGHYATMKADLRNLVTAQDYFLRNTGRLARSLEEMGDTIYQASRNVTVTLQFANDTMWSAEARHVSAPAVLCQITSYSSGARFSDPDADVPRCEPPPPSPGSLRWRWPGS